MPQYEIDFASGAVDVAALLAYVRDAERLGLDRLWVSDHPFAIAPDGTPSGALDAVVTAGFIAGATTSIGIGTLVLSASLRGPEPAASAARTLRGIAPRRALPGLGTGWYAAEHAAFGVGLRPFGERVRALGTALEGAGNPTLVGGSSAAVLALAEDAAAWNLAWDPSPDDFLRLGGSIRPGVARTVGLTVLLADDERGFAAAVDAVRRRAPFLARLEPEALREAIVCGTPEACAERIAAYHADEVALAPFVRDDPAMLEAIGSRLAPLLRARGTVGP